MNSENLSFQSFSGGSSSGVRTFFIFSGIPSYIEINCGIFPIVNVGEKVEFNFKIKDPKIQKKEYHINGLFEVSVKKLVYQTEHQSKRGLSQYLVWKNSVE